MNQQQHPQHYQCTKQCCSYTVIPYHQISPYILHFYNNGNGKLKKAGTFMYDKKTNKILLVQSRGQLWGPPKGTIQNDENPLECAIREVKEETGITIEEDVLQGSVTIKSKALYYFLEVNMEEYSVEPQHHIKDNDANGIGWFNVDCLNELIETRKISINQHCRILIKKIFNKDIVFNVSYLKKRLLPLM